MQVMGLSMKFWYYPIKPDEYTDLDVSVLFEERPEAK